MKVTVEVDAIAMEDAMKATGLKSKEKVAHAALERMAGKQWNKDLIRRLSPYFLSPSQLEDALYPGYDPKKPYQGFYEHDSNPETPRG